MKEMEPIAGIIRFPDAWWSSFAADQDDSRIDRLRQGHSRQAQHGVVWVRVHDPYVGGTVQDADRHQHAARPYGRRTGAHRYALRPDAGHVRQYSDLRRARQIRQASWPRGHQHGPFGSAAGFAAGCRSCPATRPAPGTASLHRGHAARIRRHAHKAVNEILADPKAKARFIELGAILLPGSAAESASWWGTKPRTGQVVKFAGAKVD